MKTPAEKIDWGNLTAEETAEIARRALSELAETEQLKVIEELDPN